MKGHFYLRMEQLPQPAGTFGITVISFMNIFDAEQGLAILKVTFSCDSLPKTHFVDMQVKKNHIKSIVTCRRIRRLLHFERVLSHITMQDGICV